MRLDKTNFLNTMRHPVIREWLIIAFFLSTTALVAMRGEWFSRLDQTLYDQAIALWQRPVQPDIVIIGIDEESLRQIGRWPWRRNIHATLIDRLTEAGAKAVALDVILSEPDQRDPTSDDVLAASILRNQRVVLPITARISIDGLSGESEPIPAFTNGAARLGHIASQLDNDGVVRQVFLRAGMTKPRYDLLALAVLSVADPEIRSARTGLPGETAQATKAGVAGKQPVRRGAVWATDHAYLIPYAGPPGHFMPLPYFSVLSGDYPAAAFKDKIVLIGMTVSGSGDEFPTPVSGLDRAMSGIEIHANVLQGLRQGIDLRIMPMWAAALLTVTVVLMMLLAYLWLTPQQAIALTALLSAAVFFTVLLLFRYASVWIPPVPLLLCIVLAYPLWSWRKLEATQNYLNEELMTLEQEPSVFTPEAARVIAPKGGSLLMPQRAAQTTHSSNVFVPDVVEQRIAALRAATQRLRSLNRFVVNSLESLPEAALVTDFNGNVLLANTSADKLFGTVIESALGEPKQQPLEGRDVFELMSTIQHHESHDWRGLWANVADDSRAITVEAIGVDDLEYLVQIAPSFSDIGLHTATIVTITDISPLRESERRRDEALRFLSHDMRSPQASILTLLEMQREDPSSMPSAKLNDRIGRYARRTLTLADDFLRLAKAERSKPQDFEPLDLSELLLDATEEAWTLASAKSIKIINDMPATEAWVNGDRDLLTRVLMNLLSNAIKYSPPQTSVTCRLSLNRAIPPMWFVDIIDQGYGIADADANKLFTRFARIRQEGQPEEDGIGLGLVFVKTVVLRHGGTIAVSSKVAAFQGDKRGTTFTVKLPMIEAPKD